MLQTGTLQSNTPFSKQSRNLHLAVGPVAACVVAQTSRQAGAVLASVKQTSKIPTPSLSTGTVSYQSPPLLKDFIFLTQQNNSSFMQDWNIANLIKVSEILPRSLSGNNTSLKCLSRTGFISQYHRTGGWKDDSPASHLECSRSNPSLQRRARLLSCLLNPDLHDAGALFLQQTWGQGLKSCLSTHTQTHTRLLSAEANFSTMPGVVSLPVTSLSAVSMGRTRSMLGPVGLGSPGAL